MAGSDDNLLDYLAKHMEPNDLEKAMDKSGLVYVEKTVVKDGKSHIQGYWTKPGIPDVSDTKERYTIPNTREYLEDRHNLHRGIIGNYIKQSNSPKRGVKPAAILMGGGTASGKTVLRSSVLAKKLNQLGVKAATIDYDEIKEMIPEFEDFKKNYPEHAAQLVHRESTDIGALSINALIKKKRNFIIDGTLRRPDRVEKLVDKLKKAGYQIHVYIADVPIEVAKERADKRGQETGRFVPHEIIEATHREVPQTVEAIKHKVDSYNVFDTSDGARLFASNRFVEPERYKQFLDKGKVKYNVRADR